MHHARVLQLLPYVRKKHTCTTIKNVPHKSKNEGKHTEQAHATKDIIFPTQFTKDPPGKTTPNTQNKHNNVFVGHAQSNKCSQNGDNKFSCQALRANQIAGAALIDQSRNFIQLDKWK